MSSAAKAALEQVAYGAPLLADEARAAFAEILGMRAQPQRDVRLGALLTGVLSASLGSEVLAALIDEAQVVAGLPPFPEREEPVPGSVCVAGSGKKSRPLRNISSLAALTAAAAGASVIKPVSAGTCSHLGSADLMTQLGVPVARLPRTAYAEILGACGFVATSIETSAAAFNDVYGDRFTSVNAMSFGLAAVLTPLRFNSAVFGISHPDVVLCAETLRALGVPSVTVVATRVGDRQYVDEFLALGPGIVARASPAKPEVETTSWNAADPRLAPDDFWATMRPDGSPGSNRDAAVAVMRGHGPETYTACVAAMTAPILLEAGLQPDLDTGFKHAYVLLRDGAPWDTFQKFRRLARRHIAEDGTR